MKKYNI